MTIYIVVFISRIQLQLYHHNSVDYYVSNMEIIIQSGPKVDIYSSQTNKGYKNKSAVFKTVNQLLKAQYLKK